MIHYLFFCDIKKMGRRVFLTSLRSVTVLLCSIFLVLGGGVGSALRCFLWMILPIKFVIVDWNLNFPLFMALKLIN